VSEASRWVAVGRITRAHGVRGEVSVLALTEVPARFEPGSRLVLSEDPERTLTVSTSRRHRDRVLVAFDEVSDRTTAEELRGRYLFVRASASPQLPEGEFWGHELVGCEVLTEAGRSLGTLREVIHAVANDVWVATNADAESLIPALKDVVVSVDVPERRIVVRDVPGLTAPEGR
jgi:16S rRNA processing protein RimM